MMFAALEVVSFSLIVDRALFFELMCFVDDLLFDGFDILLSLVEALEPLPLKLPSFMVVVVMVNNAGTLCLASWIERCAGTW
ncbi:unnamed protein product [Penicillium salamii]|uniref:Uncharacterized protein n=1 Tax=Penicillium salamii TaxID=1612424 RepID=A0A9W4NEL8_9EURO|nr:unnamed protein product [Penicillium salamii]